MKRTSGWKAWLAVIAFGGVPLITTATCDPYSGAISIFRDDDFGRFDGFFTDEIVVFDDFGFGDCYFECW